MKKDECAAELQCKLLYLETKNYSDAKSSEVSKLLLRQHFFLQTDAMNGSTRTQEVRRQPVFLQWK